MIKGDPKRTILVDIDRVLAPAGSEECYDGAKEFIEELSKHGDVFIYSSRDLQNAMDFVAHNGLKVSGFVEKPNPLAIIDDKAIACLGPETYDKIRLAVARRAAAFGK